MNAKKFPLTLLLPYLGLLLAAGPAPAVNYTWIGGNGNWHNSANWSPNGIPTKQADTAWIKGGVTVVLDKADIELGFLTLEAANTLMIENGRKLMIAWYAFNNGIVQLNSTGTTTTIIGSILEPPFYGSGRLILGGNINNYVHGITNSTSHIIEGGGRLGSVFNYSLILANNGVLRLTDWFWAEYGNVSATDGATLDLGAGVLVGNLTMSLLAKLTATTTSLPIRLSGNLAFYQQDPAKWNGGSGFPLRLDGKGTWQALEVGGRDYGKAAAGFSNNFTLSELTLYGTNKARAYLVDQIDNGHRNSKPEALYVNSLKVEPGCTLTLNGLHLYTYLASVIHQVAAGEGGLFGGGAILDQPPFGGSVPSIITPLLLDN